MNTDPDTAGRPRATASAGRDLKRRGLLKMAVAGAAVLGVLAATGCTPSPTTRSSSSAASATQATLNLAPGDTSDGADNFYTSDQVSAQKVTFKNQYQMNVSGNLFVPKNLDRNATNPAMVVGHPMGAVKEQSANLY
ncbi:alpha/beta hydrolase [Rhodococcus sp. IEGM 1351]|uniref:alpha/beta hydrolase n=1 Tax=Rhodococcus sp. IEGM 1351 TaxID=3047089 RepID=UPI0024B7F736|nr:alpha/beta hydrolase [Rhodococcus sp. IEGM 1351]MDI9941586.1 alpha/beta hydrolase [Rhodococcus sp. IEGM 1351]